MTPIEPHGTCTPRFEPVRAAFARNFAERGELGAAVCVTYRGELVVDLAGGVADPASGRPWEHDTIVMTWSCTKGMTALCAHLLAATGDLDLDARIVRWWPEFSGEGKQEVTVAMLLAHQAGLPGVREPLPVDAVLDFDAMAERLARERPFWVPGTRHGYHSFTFGWLVGELVRRVSGQLPGDFLRERVAGPLGADAWIGLPAREEPRVAPIEYAAMADVDTPLRRALARGEEIQVAMERSWGELTDPAACERRAVRAAQIPAVNGVASARGLALLYRPLATDGRIGDVVLPAGVRRRMSAVASAAARDATVLLPTRFSLGFQKTALPVGSGASLDWGEDAFGHSGHGGSFGFADPLRELSMAYVTNRHAEYGLGEGVRAQPLIDAAFASLA